MCFCVDSARSLWSWLTRNSAANGTALLVVITAFYAYLTARMAGAMSRQTRAMVQPIAALKIEWNGEKYTPQGYFEIKNLGTQPFLLLDIRFSCVFNPMVPYHHGEHWEFIEHPTLWDESIIPPGNVLQPMFDFRSKLDETERNWSTGELGYELRVVASDLSKSVVLVYWLLPVLSIDYCRSSLPWDVRMRYLINQFRRDVRRLQSWLPATPKRKKF